jgi:hypothetical protein
MERDWILIHLFDDIMTHEKESIRTDLVGGQVSLPLGGKHSLLSLLVQIY